MITVGSVRGKQRFEMPVRVAQEGRSRGTAGLSPAWGVSSEAKSVGGQTRLVPALTWVV
jgi:hypothetical protein